MPNPIKFVNVKVDVSATPPLLSYSGDCDAKGVVLVDIKTPTDIWMMVWTASAPGSPAPAAATLKDLTWPDGQPAWIGSLGRPSLPAGQTNPAWILTSASSIVGEKISYQLDIEYLGSPIIADPTIINVDGTNLMSERQQHGKKPPRPQRPVPAGAGPAATPPAASSLRNSGSPRRASNQGSVNHRAS
jgi:hypothetical protein